MKTKAEAVRETVKGWTTTRLLKEASSVDAEDRAKKNWSTLKRMMVESAVMELMDRGVL